MALIPPDAGLRMRLQNEANLVQPLAPVNELPSDLPDIQVGQTFLARIQEGLPENTYRALVAGKMVTLQLPEGAKAGDSLELVLVDRTPKTLIAQRVDTSTGTGAPAEPYPYANLSRAGQLIARLLLPEGEAPQPAPLSRGQALLAQGPITADRLAAALSKAVGSSGLFYESHQAQWIAGKRSLESIQAEPQGQLRPQAAPHGNLPSSPAITAGLDQPTRAPINPSPTTSIATTGEHLTETGNGQTAPANQAIPESLRPLVQQQLDALGTQRLAWHGEIWPGQVMDWQIEQERANERDGRGDQITDKPWTTTLRLQLPKLGTIDANLRLSSIGLQLQMTTNSTQTAADLRGASTTLATALGEAGLQLLSLEIHDESA